MKLNDIGAPKGATHKKKRVGRGDGSGLGKTSARGHKGQKARSGASIRPGFEGGQMPLIRRIPKRGFCNIFRVKFLAINVGDLELLFDNGEDVTVESLLNKGRVKSKDQKIKILGNGDLTKKLKIKAHAFSTSALEKIQKAGGKAEEI